MLLRHRRVRIVDWRSAVPVPLRRRRRVHIVMHGRWRLRLRGGRGPPLEHHNYVHWCEGLVCRFIHEHTRRQSKRFEYGQDRRQPRSVQKLLGGDQRRLSEFFAAEKRFLFRYRSTHEQALLQRIIEQRLQGGASRWRIWRLRVHVGERVSMRWSQKNKM